MIPKYLFLDVDGVLNHEHWYEELHKKGKDSPPFPFSCFDPECVGRVNEIIEKTGAHLVISSSWRLDKCLSETLTKVGLCSEFDVTPSWRDTVYYKKFKCRGDEIQDFLNKHPHSNYVILDDDNDMLDEQRDHFVRTCAGVETYGDVKRIEECGGTGLTEILKEKAISILNQD